MTAELEPVAWRNEHGAVTNFQHGADAWRDNGVWPEPLVTLSSAQEAMDKREERIRELERERDDKEACLHEVIRHAKAEGNRYCEDEFGAPYIVNARAEAAEARVKELEAALDEKEIASGLTRDGNLWRFWSAKAKDVATKLAAAEALLHEAMRAMDRCVHDGGFDREIGPIGCSLGDKCVCIGVYPILARSLAAKIKEAKG